MRLTLFYKILIALFSLSMLMMIGMSLLINTSFQTGFQNYLNQQEVEKLASLKPYLLAYYDEDNQWDDLKGEPRKWAQLFEIIGETPLPPPPPEFSHQHRPKLEHFEGLQPMSRRVRLLDAQKNLVVGKRPPALNSARYKKPELLAIKKEAEVIGWIELDQNQVMNDELVRSFYQQQQQNFIWIICLASLLCLGLSFILVRHFLAPLKQLQQGTKQLSQGHYGTKLKVSTQDEFADVAHTFNVLAQSLQDQQQSRQQWLTDISHELRTPIAVLRGEIEAILDGIRQPKHEYFESMSFQVTNLTKLVDDLYLLSKSDAGIMQRQTQRVDLKLLITQVCHSFEHRFSDKALDFKWHIEADAEFDYLGDEKLLTQLWINLLENSLRYTHAPGQIVLQLKSRPDDFTLTLTDSAPSVSAAHLPHLFERLYRVDPSRNRDYGGSGLGLSICQNIVNLHQGKIRAQASDLGGLSVQVVLPKRILFTEQ
ncbi:MAG: ATP-binding protein [Vibrio sp.]